MTRSIWGSGRAALLLAGTAAAASLLLSGCGAGQVAETSNKIPSVQGINVQTSDNLYKVRGLYIQYPGVEGYQAGANAPLNVVLYNDSREPVTVTVTTDGARQVALTGSAPSGAQASPSESPTEPMSGSPSPSDPSASPSQSVGPVESASASPSASASASASASSSASASASPSASANAPAGEPARIEIPALGYAQFIPASGGRQLELVGLNEALLSGQEINLTFDFGNGRTVSTGAPVGVPLTPGPKASPIITREGGAEGGGEGGGGHSG
ncbi:hypothetical protein [Micromonospora mirobrigensis]|uniref:Copper(I)-binding protein n=1 Tax=Micromonospora mirobrigensis TaxID=262898 RepID=A0A1C4ZQQ9_9ACTN|nr:hypothetical protein [Micromonospora mirobrigensis]SCF35249.1 hypothetical protein GA0070564_106178 [Micromonospora mirobrigensis]